MTAAAPSHSSRTVLVAFIAFVALGLTSGLLGLAWPTMHKQFGLSIDSIYILNVASTCTYLLTSFYIGALMARLGSGLTLLAGAIGMAVGMFGMATAPNWGTVIFFSAVSGLGTGLIDAGLNLYVATYHTARQMSWLHASFGVGVTIGPLLMTLALRLEWGWQAGYAMVGIGTVAAAALVAIARKQWRSDWCREDVEQTTRRAPLLRSLRLPIVWWGAAMFVATVGLEMAIGQWAYTLLLESRHMQKDLAGVLVAAHWGSLTVGRILFGFIAHRFDVDRLLSTLIVGWIVGTLLFWWNPVNLVGVIGLLVIGFVEAPIFPLLMAATPSRAGAPHAGNAVGMQMVSAGIAQALVPGVIGIVGKQWGLEKMSACFVALAIVALGCHAMIRRHTASPAVQLEAAPLPTA